MLENRSVLQLEGRRILIEAMPRVFRLREYTPVRVFGGMASCTATLCHRHLALKVAWTETKPTQDLRQGELVTIEWASKLEVEEGVVQIKALRSATMADEYTNLFDTVPETWPVERTLIERGRVLIQRLPRRFKHLFNAIFWDEQRFLRYLTGPASLNGPYAGLNGNFRHAIDVVDRALDEAMRHPPMFLPLVILGGLLHDAGKTGCYQVDPVLPRFVETRAGQSGAYRAILLDWLAEACDKVSIHLPGAHQRALNELLSVVGVDARWYTPEAESWYRIETQLVAAADRWTARSNRSHCLYAVAA